MKGALFFIPHLEIASGSRVLIQGPSGRGKTTLLHLLAGLLPPTEGSVALNDIELGRLSETELCRLRREKMGIIFQKLNLVAHLTAKENLLLALGGDEGDLAKALETVGMHESLSTWSQNLSLGEQQRVAVARVLYQKPQLVLADEPTSSLDDSNSKKVIASLLGLSRDTTVIVVSHDHRIRDDFDTVYDFEKLVRA